MIVTLGVLADSSNISREGKLNILGIFDIIFARSFPLVHSSMQLVMRLEAPYSEVGTQQNIRVRLLNADGTQILEVAGTVGLAGGTPGEDIISNHILNLNNVVFPTSGRYAFHILINDTERQTVPLKIIQIQSQPPAQQQR
ncbi:MAG: hypothetical protein WC543_00170 [Candidatus Omnitrophota bacterium]